MPSSRHKLKDLLPPPLEKDLTEAEKKLLEAAPKGEIADCRSGNAEIDKPENSDRWDESRTIRAEVLYWLCTDKEAKKMIHSKGVQVIGVRIKGELDFEDTTLPHPLGLFDCAIKDELTLIDADTRTLNFNGSHIGSITADRLKAKGAVFLKEGFKARGEVRFLDADIGGDLTCSNGTFENENGNALSADRLKTKGTVFMDEGFKAKGEVRFPTAKIGGDLVCKNGIFANENGRAINADTLKTKGNVFLNEGFRAKGEVLLRDAGNLVCSEGTFENENGNALSADRLETKGTFFMDKGFKAKGEVRFLGADIGGDLVCSEGTFENENGNALSADKLKTKGTVFLNDGFQAKGKVRLLGADIGGNLSCSGGTFENEKGLALNAEGAKVDGIFFWQTRAKPVGMLDLMHARVGQFVDNKESWPEKKKLFLDGFEYEALAGDKTPTRAEDRLEWIHLQPDKPFKPQPYEQLAKVLREMGHEKDARKVLIAKKRDLRRYGELNWYEKSGNRLLDIFIGYGWKPWNAIIFFLLLSSGVFWCADTELQVMQPSKERVYMHEDFKKSGAIPSTYPKFNPFIYSVDTFVPFVNLHQENYWLPDASKPYGRWFRLYFWLHIAFGWGLSTWLAVMLTTLFTRSLE
jgi:sRNA-binding regulator protein Hfq